MNRLRPLIVVALLIAAGVIAWLVLGGTKRERTLSGYIEGQDLYLAAPMAGTLASIPAVEGQRVVAGQHLFTIDPATLAAQGQQAQANVAAAKTQIASAQAQAQQADADVAAAQADAQKARQDLARLLKVKRDDNAAVAGKDIDAARAALRSANSHVASAQKVAQARRAQIAASRAQTVQAQGGAREVAIRVNQLSPPAPSNALIEDVYFQAGEWVNANQPVVALIPDNKIKVRFYVPEEEVARYRPGQVVHFSCDACAPGLSARIAYVSPRPEFTPPVIFSRDSRDRLVFMVEAYPTKPTQLMPGLPVDVEPLPGTE
ncbi:MAG TPA: HlyD family efflux transporter periplasmic adaptor subunit [Sphingomicrobium sp.]|nr:HlyD family efflux transporter periplasmic adaptor subunit [Sphingomicrobium sp.]